MTKTVVIAHRGGTVDVDFLPDGVDVLIVDLNGGETFTIDGELECVITEVNGNGTLNVRIIDGKDYGKMFRDVQASRLEFLEKHDDDDMEEDDEWPEILL